MCSNSANTQPSPAFLLSAFGLQITLEGGRKESTLASIAHGQAATLELPCPSIFFYPTPDMMWVPTSKKGMCLGECLHTPLFPLPPPRILSFAPRKSRLIPSKIPNILNLLSECFFQYNSHENSYFQVYLMDSSHTLVSQLFNILSLPWPPTARALCSHSGTIQNSQCQALHSPTTSLFSL